MTWKFITIFTSSISRTLYAVSWPLLNWELIVNIVNDQKAFHPLSRVLSVLCIDYNFWNHSNAALSKLTKCHQHLSSMRIDYLTSQLFTYVASNQLLPRARQLSLVQISSPNHFTVSSPPFSSIVVAQNFKKLSKFPVISFLSAFTVPLEILA